MNIGPLKLSSKILALNLIAFICLIVFIFPKVKEMAYEGKRKQTRHLVESAEGVLNYYQNQIITGEMKEKEAQEQALGVLRQLHYDRDNYFFVTDYNRVILMHPNKDLVGKNQSATQDAKGKYLFQEMDQVAREKGEGFVDYYWTKLQASESSPKITFVKAYSKWGWVVGTGIYVDDVEQELREWLITIIIISLVIISALTFFTLRFSQTIIRPIRNVIEGISRGADQMTTTSAMVAQAGHSLTEGSLDQAAALEETSASVEEMSSMAKLNSEKSKEAKIMVNQADRIAAKAENHMEQMIEAIALIAQSSEQTGEIIKTINTIAFQTRILAINAAVAAGRAGESGAGFAVVADEIGKLAKRTTEAAEHTDYLLEQIRVAVLKGNELTHSTQEVFKENKQITVEVSRIMEGIVAASWEQALGVEQINQTITSLDKVVQKNVDYAQGAAMAARAMNEQIFRMKQFIQELFTVVGSKGKDRGQIGEGKTLEKIKGINGDLALPVKGIPPILPNLLKPTK